MKACSMIIQQEAAIRQFKIVRTDGRTFDVTLKGRSLWALEQLIQAGAVGCTAIDAPAPRWAAYVFYLREAGIQIDTIAEAHGGAFPGHHARYVLRSNVAEVVQ